MKVLQIVTSFPRDDWPRNGFIKSQIDSLSKIGVDIDVFQINNPPRKINYLLSFFRFRKLISTKQYDLIHAHYIYPGITAISQRKVPVLFSYMGSEILGTPNRNGKITLIGYLNIFLSKMLQFLVDRIIVKSDNLLEQLTLKHKAHVIPNGVNYKIFKPIDKKDCRKELGLSQESKIILFLGRLNDPRKNYALAKSAVKRLNESEIEDYVLLSPDSILPEEVPIYLNASNILLHTSLWEGSPNLIKEAMACNIPIVSTDVGDVKKVIGNTAGCFLTNFDDESVSKSILEAFNFHNRTNGRNDISHLEIEKVAYQIKDIYEEMLLK